MWSLFDFGSRSAVLYESAMASNSAYSTEPFLELNFREFLRFVDPIIRALCPPLPKTVLAEAVGVLLG